MFINWFASRYMLVLFWTVLIFYYYFEHEWTRTFNLFHQIQSNRYNLPNSYFNIQLEKTKQNKTRLHLRVVNSNGQLFFTTKTKIIIILSSSSCGCLRINLNLSFCPCEKDGINGFFYLRNIRSFSSSYWPKFICCQHLNTNIQLVRLP